MATRICLHSIQIPVSSLEKIHLHSEISVLIDLQGTLVMFAALNVIVALFAFWLCWYFERSVPWISFVPCRSKMLKKLVIIILPNVTTFSLAFPMSSLW